MQAKNAFSEHNTLFSEGKRSAKKPAARLLVVALALCVSLSWGCSWTQGLFGSEESPQQAVAEEQTQEEAQGETETAQEQGAQAQQKSSDGLVPRPERSPRSKQAATTPTPSDAASDSAAAQPEETAERSPAETAEKDAGEAGQTVAAVEEPKPEEPVKPLKAKGVVPIERTKKDTDAPKSAVTGEVYYETSKELHDAIQKAIENESFLGYTDPFDAFPVLDGVDTMSAAFIPVDHPDHKVFYHAFFQPTQPFHKRVYGYTVINMSTNQDQGFFDGNADGIFEQKTLDPKIVLDDYLRAAKEAGPGEDAAAPTPAD